MFTLPLQQIFDKKHLLREQMTAERRALAAGRPDAGVHAARMFLQHIETTSDDIVALYHPIKHELDTEPLFDALVDLGVSIALPVTIKKNAPLEFRGFAPNDLLQKGKFGVMEPTDDAPTLIPSIVVTPLLGFTRRGRRLGYGGGYYDRTLAELRRNGQVTAIGYGFGGQEVDDLPVSDHDEPLDWVVTERDAFQPA